MVWAVSASPGSTVTEGQTILDLANCAHRFVVVDLPERSFEQIKANDPTAIRLIGSEEWRQGRVRQVLGSAARSDDRLLAAQVPHPTSSSVTVEVELLQDKSEAERNSFAIRPLDGGPFPAHRIWLDRPSVQGVAGMAGRW